MEWKNTDVAINDIRVLFVRYQNIFLINEVRKEDNMSRRFKGGFQIHALFRKKLASSQVKCRRKFSEKIIKNDCFCTSSVIIRLSKVYLDDVFEFCLVYESSICFCFLHHINSHVLELSSRRRQSIFFCLAEPSIAFQLTTRKFFSIMTEVFLLPPSNDQLKDFVVF